MSKGIITKEEMKLARKCLEDALSSGADSCRVTLDKTIQNSICILDGKLDKISYCADRSLFLYIFAGQRYGTFSTNRLEEKELKDFVRQGVEMTRLMQEDPFRRLPAPERKAAKCADGDEMRIMDAGYADIDTETKKDIALKASELKDGDGWHIDSADNEYFDSLEDSLMLDSDGFEGRQIETSYGFSSEVTVSDSSGNKHCCSRWVCNPFFADLDVSAVAEEAVQAAARQIGNGSIKSGRYTVIIDRHCSNRLVRPIFSALDAMSIQQNNSFLADALEKKVFSDHFTLDDLPLEKGCPGSRRFDSEGVATADRRIIDHGVVKTFFVDSYMAGKTGMAPTVDNVSRPCISPFICNCGKKRINLNDILEHFRNALYITDFNGGNCNVGTGDFSFGVEGLIVRDGKLAEPVQGILMTGNMMHLWNSLAAAGSDALEFTRWRIPTLAFKDVDINA